MTFITSGKKKLYTALSAIGPGLFLIGYNIGTGSITTMAKTGAEHGMKLFWALLMSCIFTYILMVAYGKVTLVTGNTALINIKSKLKHGWILALYILCALIIGEVLALIGVMGIVADLTQEGLRMVSGHTMDKIWIILFFVAVFYLLLWFGRYQTFEKVLTVFVILMGISFIVVFFMVKPNFNNIIAGLLPTIPKTPGSLGLIAAITGTTCSAAVFIMRSTVVKEKGWGINQLKTEKKDSFVSSLTMLILSGIGENGHIAFNDPPVADFNDPRLVKVVALDHKSRVQQLNEGWFSTIEEVPKEAISLTIPAILNSKTISCVVPDQRKSNAIYNTMYAKISHDCPSTILRRHRNTTVFLDVHSASKIDSGS